MITSILQEMGLSASPHDPCLYSGIIHSDNKSLSERKEINVGLYVHDFVFFSTSQAEEDLFQKVLATHIKADFMGDADHFLGTAFT